MRLSRDYSLLASWPPTLLAVDRAWSPIIRVQVRVLAWRLVRWHSPIIRAGRGGLVRYHPLRSTVMRAVGYMKFMQKRCEAAVERERQRQQKVVTLKPIVIASSRADVDQALKAAALQQHPPIRRIITP